MVVKNVLGQTIADRMLNHLGVIVKDRFVSSPALAKTSPEKVSAMLIRLKRFAESPSPAVRVIKRALLSLALAPD